MGEPAAWIVVLTGLAAGVFAGVWLARRVRRTQAGDGDAESRRIRNEAELERQPLLCEAEIQAREQALATRLEAETSFRAQEAELAQKETALAARKVRIDEEGRQLEELREGLKSRTALLAEGEQEGRALVSELQSVEKERRAGLE